MTYQEYLKLCAEIKEHDRLYFVEHAPVISDEQYDYLFRKLEEMERAHPEWILPDSPTKRKGEMLTAGYASVKHKVPMLSLANTYSEQEVEDFIARMERLIHRKELAMTCELKMDGIAISVSYKKGQYVRALTRGDGKKGDDITQNIKTIPTLPLSLKGEHLPETLEVRGEVFMLLKDFETLNALRKKNEETPFANPRNAAAGSLKLLDRNEVAERKLQIVFYGIAETSEKLKSQYACHQYLRALGLPTLPEVQLCHSQEQVRDFIHTIYRQREGLPFQIDGIVIKLDDLFEQKRLGVTGKNPRWAVAYKFAAEQAITRIREITVQVGRTGVLTPVAELEPVFLAGSTISRATLHNQDEIKRKDIRVGDLVTIEKGGDVIPKVVQVDLTVRDPKIPKWQMPSKCPSCDHLVIHSSGEVAIRCPNPSCPAKHLRNLTYFASKAAMDIEELGVKVMEQLVSRAFVKRPSDIFTLTEKELFQLEGFKEKAVQNLLMSIARSKETSLERFIMALGVKYVGAETADLLAGRAGDLDTLLKMTKEQLLSIDGIGPKVAKSLVDYFSDPLHLEEIERLLKAGVHPQPVVVKTFQQHPFCSKTFVLTGSLEHYTRNAAAALIKERGGKVTATVSKNTDYVLAGESPGSKLDKAHKLNIPILLEAEFQKML